MVHGTYLPVSNLLEIIWFLGMELEGDDFIVFYYYICKISAMLAIVITVIETNVH